MNSIKLTSLAAVLLAGTAFASMPALSQDTGGSAAQDQSTGETDAGAGTGEASTPTENAAGADATQEQNAGDADTGASTDDAGSVAGEAPAEPEEEGQAATTSPSGETTASINITEEQKTEIRDVIVQSDAEPADVDIDVSVGVAVPDTVELHPLPPRIVEVVPEYEGYMYFVLANGEIVIVDPDSHEVVYVIVG